MGVIIPAGEFICGPDVTTQIATTWTRIQNDFKTWSDDDKKRACRTILIPYKGTDGWSFPTSAEELKAKIQAHSDIDGWDTIPLFQGASQWLRTPPIYDPATNGPCATPSSSDYNNIDQFADAHEDPNTCSNTVQVAGQCWLNGTVNYGTFGIMVKLCSDFALSRPYLLLDPSIGITFNIAWARTLIRAYKKFGQNPEGAVLPIAWTDATYYGGPRGVPSVPGNRQRCKCSCGCTGDVPTTNWDYIWKPVKNFGRATR
jgi:hypothetical protein